MKQDAKIKPIQSSLTREEVCALAQRMEAGDGGAREQLIISHLPLVAYMARLYSRREHLLTFDDLYQEGCCGLVQAVDRYDYRKGVLLSSYASFYITKYFNEATRKDNYITLPENIYYLLQKYFVAKRTIYRVKDTQATVEDLSKALNLSEKKVLKLQLFLHEFVSLEADPGMSAEDGDKGTVSLHNVIVPFGPRRPVEEEALKNICPLDLGELQVPLTKREAEILRRRFGMTESGEPETFKSIGSALGLTGESVRLTYQETLKKIRKAAREQGIVAASIFDTGQIFL